MAISAEDLSALTPSEQEAVLAAQQPETEDAPEVVSESVAETPEVEDTNVEPVAEADAVAEEIPHQSGFIPEFKVDSIDGAQERIAGIGQQIKEIRRMRDEGEIDYSEADNQIDALNDEKRQIEITEAQAKWSAKQNEEIEQQFNARITKQFFDRDTSKMYEDKIMYRVLDNTVAELRSSNPEKGYEWALVESDKLVRARFGALAAPALKAVETPTRQMPPTVRTIGDIPAAAPNPTGDDRAEKIGMLEGEELEQYVGRMSADDRKKLSRAA